MNHKETGAYDNPVTATLKGITDLFKKQKRAGELKDSDRLEGKTVMITGASSGLGFATAAELAKRGARVIMACRSGIPEKGEEIQHKSGSHMVEMIHVDLSDISSIKNLVSELKTRKVKINILIFYKEFFLQFLFQI